MSNEQLLLQAVIDPSRSLAQRLESLAQLAPHLRSDSLVMALLAALVTDPDPAFRRAALLQVLAAEAGVIQDQVRYGELLGQLAVHDSEDDIRVTALRQLAEVPVAEDWYAVLMLELMEQESGEPQIIALNALSHFPRLSEEGQARIAQFSAQCPARMLGALSLAARGAEDKVREKIWAGALAPSRPTPLKLEALTALEQWGVLSERTLEAIGDLLAGSEPDMVLQKALALLVRFGAESARVADRIFQQLARTDQNQGLIQLLENQLASHPELVPRLTTLFSRGGPASLQVDLLNLLAESPAVVLLAVPALAAKDPWLRRAAMAAGLRWLHSTPDVVVPGLVGSLALEADEAMRLEILQGLEALPTWPAAAEQTFLGIFELELPGPVRWQMVARLARMAPQAATGSRIRRGLLNTLADVASPAAVRLQALDALEALPPCQEATELAVLEQALRTAPEMNEADRLQRLWKRGFPEEQRDHALLADLFFRFAWRYPEAPVDHWSHDLAAWAARQPNADELLLAMLDATGNPEVFPAGLASEPSPVFIQKILEDMRGGVVEAWRAKSEMQEAFNQGRLRKKDLIRLFKIAIHWPHEYPLMSPLLAIAEAAALADPDVLALCMDFIQFYPHGKVWSEHQAPDAAYAMEKYLLAVAPLCPEFPARLTQHLTGERHFKFLAMGPGARPGSNHGWRETTGQEWPIYRLAKALDPTGLLLPVLENESFHTEWPEHMHLSHTILRDLQFMLNPGEVEFRALAVCRERLDQKKFPYLAGRAEAVQQQLLKRKA